MKVGNTESSESISSRKNNKQRKKEKKKCLPFQQYTFTQHTHIITTIDDSLLSQKHKCAHIHMWVLLSIQWGLAHNYGMRKITFVILSFLCLFSLSVLYFCRVHRAAHLHWRTVLYSFQSINASWKLLRTGHTLNLSFESTLKSVKIIILVVLKLMI